MLNTLSLFFNDSWWTFIHKEQLIHNIIYICSSNLLFLCRLSCLHNTYCVSVVTSYSFIWWSRITARKLSTLAEIRWTVLASCWGMFPSRVVELLVHTAAAVTINTYPVYRVQSSLRRDREIDAAQHFCRATLCKSAVFAVGRWLSVTIVYCMQTAEDIVKPLSRSASPIILVLWFRAPVPNCKKNPSAGALNARGLDWATLILSGLSCHRAFSAWSRNRRRKAFFIIWLQNRLKALSKLTSLPTVCYKTRHSNQVSN